jgi:hypothetical protein
MRAHIRTVFRMVIQGVIFCLVVWGFIEAVQADPAVAGSVATAIAGVSGVVWQQRQSEKARVREAHRSRMTPVYHEMLKLVRQQVSQETLREARLSRTTTVYQELRKVVRRQASREPVGPADDLDAFMSDFKASGLMIGAPSEMIHAFNQWESATRLAEETNDDSGLIFAWENLLRAIRRDLGHDDSKLPNRELLRIFFVEDFDKSLAELEAKATGARRHSRRSPADTHEPPSR